MEKLKLAEYEILCRTIIDDDGVKKYPVVRCDTGEVMGLIEVSQKIIDCAKF